MRAKNDDASLRARLQASSLTPALGWLGEGAAVRAPGELVEFVRRVLQVIPASMFDILNEIINIQTNRLQEVPTRLEKDRLKEYGPAGRVWEDAKWL